MKIPSRFQIYKFFQVANPFDDPDHDPLVALKWAGVTAGLVLVGSGVVAILGTLLWALYTEAWVWVRIVATPIIFLPLIVLWLAWPSKKKQAAAFLEKGK